MLPLVPEFLDTWKMFCSLFKVESELASIGSSSSLQVLLHTDFNIYQ